MSGAPARPPSLLDETDLRLIAEGRHDRLWQVLGAHVRTSDGVRGTDFAVWAPRARTVHVVGDFNGWDGADHALHPRGASGAWELFVPDAGPGDRYMFEIVTGDGRRTSEADPMARRAQTPPETASVVADDSYTWHDGAWMTRRVATHAVAQPLSVYEMHLGSWRQGLGYRSIAEPLIAHMHETGFTHVEFLPLAEHPFGGSWDYPVGGSYAPASRYGTPDDLRHLIDRLHQAGIGVILDWMPGRVPWDDPSQARFAPDRLDERPDPHRGEQPDRGALIFDVGRPEVRGFLVANALYWLSEFHVDGLHVDAVASLLHRGGSRRPGEEDPNVHGGREDRDAIRFFQELNATVHRLHPGVLTIAEEATSFPGVTAPADQGGLGFGFKRNTGWTNDSLRFMQRDPAHRSHHEGEMTFSFMYAFGEDYVLPISHDDLVHGEGGLVAKMPGDHAHRLADARAYLAFMWAHPGKKLLFMGQEFGQLSEWSDARQVDWWLLEQPAHRGMLRLVSDLNALYRSQSPLWELDDDARSFQRLGGRDQDQDIIAFERRDTHRGRLVVVSNFAGVARVDLRLALPAVGEWRQVLHSDAVQYGGSGAGNPTVVDARPTGDGGQAVATMTVPALSTLWLRWTP